MLDSVSLVVEDARAPGPTEAAAFARSLIEHLQPHGTPLRIVPGHFAPKDGVPWGIIEAIDLNHPDLANFENGSLLYLPDVNGRRVFTLRLSTVEGPGSAKARADTCAAFLVECAHRLLPLYDFTYGYIRSSAGGPKPPETKGDVFPRAVTWWMWVNQAIADTVGKDVLLSAPVHKAYEVANGIAWLQTERISKPADRHLAQRLKAHLPGGPKVRVVGWAREIPWDN